MNYAQSFEEFSRGLTPKDLVVYAGAALVLFALFQEKLNPVKEWIIKTYNSFISNISKETIITPVNLPKSDNDFLQLVKSWKGTRDLAELMGCSQAVKILDGAFPHLGPNKCGSEDLSEETS
jgi:hypothetical protein